MTLRPLSPVSSLRAFYDDTRGIAAVEMAFIAPIALFLLSLAVAAGQILTTYHKVVLAAHSAADLISSTAYSADPNTQAAEILNLSDLNTDLALAQLVLYPEVTTNTQIVVSELKINAASNNGKVVWSQATSNATALSKNTTVTLDSSLVATGAAYVIIAQATYAFQPFGGMFSLPPFTLSATETLTIRNANQMTLNTNG